MIKAIETRYKGCRFRSRTEARWAVLFDALDIRWEYEKEGFDLYGVGKYLPDFWLPDLDIWVEVKGGEASGSELARCGALADETEKCVLLVMGTPEEGAEQIWFFAPGRSGQSGCVLTSRGNAICKNKITVGFGSARKLSGRASVPNSFLRKAINKARSARFEHGEKP